MDAESGELFLGGALAFRPLQDWPVDPDCRLDDSEPEDVLHAVDPNEVFPSGPAAADASSESDSGISEDPVLESPVFQVVYDLGAVKSEPGHENVISIELDEWSSQLLFSDSCVVNELPVLPAAAAAAAAGLDAELLSLDLQLTEEEQKLLSQEGVSLPGHLPLTKAEERILKRVRRKIRNKQSAQDSRRRRKDYIDGLESRVAACSVQNKDLQRTVEQLEKRNMSLLAQLQQLRSLIKQTASKGAQTSTCLLIILVSLGLIIMPSFSPFSRGSSADDDYRPTGVISRNILTDPSSSSSSSSSSPKATADDAGGPPAVHSAPPDLGPSGPLGGSEPTGDPERPGSDGTAEEASQSGNGSALVAGQTQRAALDLRSTAGKGSRDPSKPAHADEM